MKDWVDPREHISMEKLHGWDLEWDELPERVDNPLAVIMDRKDAMDEVLLDLFRRPENAYLTCKLMLGVDLLPFQALWLNTIWYKAFPMLIGVRGAGKALRPNELVRVKDGWKEIKDIKAGDLVYGSDGKLTAVKWNSGIQSNLDFYRIKLSDGRFIECCGDHQWKVYIDGKLFPAISTLQLKYRMAMGLKVEIPNVKQIDDDLFKSDGGERYLAADRVRFTALYHVGKGDGVCIAVDNDDSTYVTKDYIVTHNSWILGLYSVLRATFLQERKVVITGSAFRQAKQVFEYCEKFWFKSPVLRSLFPKDVRQGISRDPDRWTFNLGNSTITAIPTGNGESIRGLRANDIIIDEFKSCNPEIIETVITGFGSVSAAPAENVKKEAKLRWMLKQGKITQDEVEEIRRTFMGNQIIISGTADFTWNHFYQYYDKYRRIIETRGDKREMQNLLGKDADMGSISYKDFAIIRMPYELVPRGFMDERQIIRAKGTMNSGRFACEYGASFISDSMGFFRMKTIESCTVNRLKPITLPSGKVDFNLAIVGEPGRKYIIGVDPASERDNFAIVILEVHPDHRRIVYCWTVNRKKFDKARKADASIDQDYYKFAARKIRSLMSVFDTEALIIDPEGGGRVIAQVFQDPKNCDAGEVPILPVIDWDKPKPTDDEAGAHILHFAEFSTLKWLSDANHGLRADMENKKIFFPYYDSLLIDTIDQEVKVIETENKYGHRDKIEDNIAEIEALKEELSTIICTPTATGKESWDTPEIKLENGKKGRQRKDRYSALLIANMLARTLAACTNSGESIFYKSENINDGRGTLRNNKDKTEGNAYSGPSWFTENANKFING